MDDAIRRQAAIDEISKYASIWMEYDADMTQEEVAEAALNAAKRTMVHILEELPPTQPKIVQCRDCRYHIPQDGRCRLWCQFVDSSEWCSRAVRKDGESDGQR